jgi:hypothetical protein
LSRGISTLPMRQRLKKWSDLNHGTMPAWKAGALMGTTTREGLNGSGKCLRSQIVRMPLPYSYNKAIKNQAINDAQQ